MSTEHTTSSTHAASSVATDFGITLTAPARQPMQRFGKYEVIGELGEGGMGRVYKAVDTELGRFVAVKVLRSTDPFEASRFRGEAEMIAALDHPNIVKVYDIATTPDERPYLVLEYCEGGSLDRELAGNPQEPRRAAEMIETVARAVQFAHEKGVIHRDLKPANVLRGKDKVLKLTDFGLAKELEVSSGMTPSNAVMGTPSYMSPEQAAGNVKQLGPPTDVYGLGAILYEMITGRPPFRGVNMVDTLEQVRWAEPAPPSRLVPRIHRDLATICLKCLQKAPARRYQTAGELADDLRRWLNGETIAARRAPSWERAVRQIRRRPWQAAAFAVTALLIGLAVTSALYVRDKSKEKEADVRVLAEREAQEITQAAIKKEANDKVLAERAAREKDLNRRLNELFVVLESIRKQLAEELKSTPGLDGLNREVTGFYRRLIDERLADPNADRTDLAKRTFEIGELAARSGQFEMAVWGFRQAHALYTGLSPDVKTRVKAADAQMLLARAVFDLGQDAEALEIIKAAHASWTAIAADTATAEPALNRPAGPHSEALTYRLARSQLAEIEQMRGEVHVRRHELAAAKEAFHKSIDLRRDVGRERLDFTAEELVNKLDGTRRSRALSDLRDLGRAYGWLGGVFLSEGDISHADQAYCQSHKIRELVVAALELIPHRTAEEEFEFEKARFHLARSWINQASFQSGHRAYATAATFTQRALVLREALVGTSSNNVEYTLDLCNNLNQTVELELLNTPKKPDEKPDDWKKATASLDRAIELASAHEGRGSRALPPLAESYALRAELLERSGSGAAAVAPALAAARARFEELCKRYTNQPNYQFRLATLLAMDARLKSAAPDAAPWQEVLEALKQAVEKGYRGKHPDAIRDIPAFGPVRDDERFKALLAKLRT